MKTFLFMKKIEHNPRKAKTPSFTFLPEVVCLNYESERNPKLDLVGCPIYWAGFLVFR